MYGNCIDESTHQNKIWTIVWQLYRWIHAPKQISDLIRDIFKDIPDWCKIYNITNLKLKYVTLPYKCITCHQILKESLKSKWTTIRRKTYISFNDSFSIYSVDLTVPMLNWIFQATCAACSCLRQWRELRPSDLFVAAVGNSPTTAHCIHVWLAWLTGVYTRVIGLIDWCVYWTYLETSPWT